MLADGEHVVEVEAVIGSVLRRLVVDGHSAEPAWTVFALAFEEEFLAVFLELSSAFADLAAVADHVAVTPQSLKSKWLGRDSNSRWPDMVSLF